MGKPKFTNRNGVTLVTTRRMHNTAKQALTVLEDRNIKGITLQEIDFTRFPCGEVKPKIKVNVRHKDVFLFFDFNNRAPNDDIVNLMLTIGALHLADAKRITLVLPHMPYLRQDRKDEPRTPISAAWFLKSLQMWDTVRRVITIDMHSEQLQAVLDIPSDHLPGRILFARWAKQYFKGDYSNLVAVAPDFGSAKRVRKLAYDIDPSVPVAILEKNREKKKVEMLNIIGASVKNKTCLINDDMMDTCGTIILAAEALYQQGASSVILSATHPIFSPNGGTTAYEKLAKAKVHVVVSDSLQTESHPWLEVLPLGELIGLVILQNITPDGSVSKLIRNGIEVL